MARCPWAKGELYEAYHDRQWGVPVHDDRMLFEMLNLEGAQAGLSWITILKKREGYREAFEGWDAEAIARMGPRDVERLMQNEGIVRNRLKIESTITNAKAFLKVRETGSFDELVWGFVGGKPIVNRRKTMKEVPARTDESDAMSKMLKKHGFKFVGTTICYAYMQAVGMVNDHLVGCERWGEVQGR